MHHKWEELLRRWPQLPDDALVPVKLTCLLTGRCDKTLRNDKRLKRVYFGKRHYGFRAGDVRRLLAGVGTGGDARQ
jgi:hypothetical protein